jgi:putative ubiquitin-RnfH superfamily antitoxin RatB of RatAB toxin-antitoxin module
MAPEQHIAVEIAYAKPGEQILEQLTVPADSSVESVIRRSGILERYPEIDLAVNKVGVFGKVSRLDAGLRDGDRIEIYRPLIADPKEARKKRAAEGKAMKKGARDEAGDQSS